jgi:hypothetical protein
MRSEVRLVVASAVITLGALAAVAVSCTDGATPDCTGDAAASCGPLPGSIEASAEGASGEGGSTTEGGGGTDGSMQTVDAGSGTDTGTMDMDAGDDADGGLLGDI